MKPDNRAHHTADDWQGFLETIQAGYRYLHSLERELTALPEQGWDLPKQRHYERNWRVRSPKC